MAIARNRKGILLTLVTIVLLVLMIAELITYVYLTIDYETVSSFGSVSAGGYKFADTLTAGTVSFLHLSLSSALNTVGTYENSNTRKGSYLVNSTSYSLQSLMSNGMLYGTNEITLMGGATLVNYTNAIIKQGKYAELNVIITNASLQVYQPTPYSINATYTALAVINSSSGLFTYPIIASSGVYLNGTPDLYGIQNNNNNKIQISAAPKASVVGNAYALSGSTSPFRFIYGTVIEVNSVSSCSNIPARFENNNYILAISNDAVGACGFGGVVTYTPSNVAYGVPYLVYSPSSNILSYLNNGTSLLLNGKGLSLLNVSSFQSALHSGDYFASSFAPSFLSLAQGDASQRSPSGIFSLGIYNRLVPVFSPSANTAITTNIIFTSANPKLSISLWFNSKNFISSYSNTVLVQEGPRSGNVFALQLKNSQFIFGSQVGACQSISSLPMNNAIAPNTWHNIVAVFNSSGTSYIYLDGLQIAQGSFSLCTSGNTGFEIGAGSAGSFNGSIANIQAYNISLSHAQAAHLYYEGLDGIAVSARNLTGWWPLNGNANDYSGKKNNGSITSNNPANAINYKYLYNYFGDPEYDGAFYSPNLTNIVQGGVTCMNFSECSNSTLQHATIGSATLGSSSEAGSLGFANALVPNVGSFNGNGYAFANIAPYYGGNNQFSFSAWVYLNSSASGPVVDVVGCAVPPGSCTSSPIISISKNTIYGSLAGMNSGAPLVYTAPSSNTWHNVVFTYTPSGTETLYVDGVSVGSGGGSFTGNGGTSDYWTTECGTSCTPVSGVANTLSGKIADVQFYKSQLTNAQVSQLYQNDSVIGVNTDNSWPLSIGFDGLTNQSVNSANSLNPAYLANNQGVCSNANAINKICGASFTQP
jgi:hypothetical protein